MAASVLSFLQMVLFSVVTGAVAPLTFGSAFRMALGIGIGFLIACAGWYAFRGPARKSRVHAEIH
jgi:DHA1 family bicyclomycin/chloramphenicol resistance-like MFS transporter